MLIDFDVVVDIDGCDLPLGVLVGFLRERQSVGLIEEEEKFAAGLLELSKGSVV
jgi:hypothetical protein